MPFIYWPYIGSVFKKSLNIAKKITIIVVTYVVIVNLFIYFIQKDQINLVKTNPINSPRAKIYQVLNSPEASSTLTNKIIVGIFRTTTCWTMGEGCTDNPQDGDYHSKHSLIANLSGILITPLVYPPASGLYWTYSGLQNAGFIPKTYAAQGIGFAALGGYRQIWLMFRNFSMLILVLVIVAIGFMIMFRTKINPQTVISIESALPKIVITLFLITFSFAIAGFLIDLTYVIIGMIVILFQSNSFAKSAIGIKSASDFYKNSGTIWNMIHPFHIGMLWNISGSLLDLLPHELTNVVNTLLSSLLINLLLPVFGALSGGISAATLKLAGQSTGKLFTIAEKTESLSKIFKAATASEMLKTFGSKAGLLNKLTSLFTKAGGSGQPVASLIFAVVSVVIPIILQVVFGPWSLKAILTILLVFTLLLIFFRILFMLISCYVNIVVYVIFAPIILLLEAIPGKSTFAAWIKNLTVNLATFPVFIVLVFVARIIITIPESGDAIWRPPMLSDYNIPLENIVGGFILFSIPDIIKGLKQMLGIKPLLPFEFGLGAFFTGVGAAVGGVSKGVGFTTSLATAPLIGNLVRHSPVYGKLIESGIIPKTQAQFTGEAVAESLKPLIDKK